MFFFDLINVLFCLSGVIARSYIVSCIQQFCKTMFCLFPSSSLDAIIRMIDSQSSY